MSNAIVFMGHFLSGHRAVCRFRALMDRCRTFYLELLRRRARVFQDAITLIEQFVLDKLCALEALVCCLGLL